MFNHNNYSVTVMPAPSQGGGRAGTQILFDSDADGEEHLHEQQTFRTIRSRAMGENLAR